MKKVLVLGLITLVFGLFGCGGGGGSDSSDDATNNPTSENTDISKVSKTNIGSNTKYLFLKEASVNSSSLSVNESNSGTVLYQMFEDGNIQQVNFYDAQDQIINMYGSGYYATRIMSTSDANYFIILFEKENGYAEDTYHSVFIRVADGAVYYIGPKGVNDGSINSQSLFGDSVYLFEIGLENLNYPTNNFLQQDGSGNIYYSARVSNQTYSVFKLSNIDTNPSEQALTGSSEKCYSFMVESNGNVLLSCYLNNNNYIKVRRSDGTYSSEDERIFLSDNLQLDSWVYPIFIGSNDKINYLNFNLDAMIDTSSWDIINPSCGSPFSDVVGNVFIDYLDTTLPEVTSGSNYATISYVNQSVTTNLLATTINKDLKYPVVLLDVKTSYLLYLGLVRSIVVEQEEVQDEWNNCSYIAVNSVTVDGIPLDLNDPDWQSYVDSSETGDYTIAIFKVGTGNNNIEQVTFSDLSKFISTQSYNGFVYFLAKKKSNTNRDIVYRYTPATNTLDVIYSANTSDIEIFKMEVDASGVFVYAINQLNGNTIYGKIEGGVINQLQTVDLDGPVDLIRLL